MGGFREFTKVEILAAMEQHTKQVWVVSSSIGVEGGCLFQVRRRVSLS